MAGIRRFAVSELGPFLEEALWVQGMTRGLQGGCLVQWLCLGSAEAATYLPSALGDSSCIGGDQ